MVVGQRVVVTQVHGERSGQTQEAEGRCADATWKSRAQSEQSSDVVHTLVSVVSTSSITSTHRHVTGFSPLLLQASTGSDLSARRSARTRSSTQLSSGGAPRTARVTPVTLQDREDMLTHSGSGFQPLDSSAAERYSTV